MEKKRMRIGSLLRAVLLLMGIFSSKIYVEASVVDRSLDSCLQLWTELDLLRAIRYSPDQYKVLLEKIMEEFLLLYQPLVTRLPALGDAQSCDSVISLYEMCDAIGFSLEELYQKAAPHKLVHESHICMQVVLRRIMQRLQESLEIVNT